MFLSLTFGGILKIESLDVFNYTVDSKYCGLVADVNICYSSVKEYGCYLTNKTSPTLEELKNLVSWQRRLHCLFLLIIVEGG